MATTPTDVTGDIGPIPEIVDPARREACRLDFPLFCETYLARTFRRPWTPFELQLLLEIECIVLAGGLRVSLVQPGTGTSSLCDAAVVWSICYRHHEYVMLVRDAHSGRSGVAVSQIREEFEHNRLLAMDFPEICHPVSKLQGVHSRAARQNVAGERTRIHWRGGRLIFPTIGSAAGVVLDSGPLYGRTFVGAQHHRPDGTTVRPTLVILDNPESGDSVAELFKDERLISKTVPTLAGPSRKMSAFMPCVSRRPGDLAALMCDPQRHRAWH